MYLIYNGRKEEISKECLVAWTKPIKDRAQQIKTFLDEAYPILDWDFIYYCIDTDTDESIKENHATTEEEINYIQANIELSYMDKYYHRLILKDID